MSEKIQWLTGNWVAATQLLMFLLVKLYHLVPWYPFNTLCGVKALAAEAETGSIFLKAQEAVPLVTALEALGHPQPKSGTSLETNNSTAHSILHTQVRMKKSKAFDMRYHWLRNRIAQGQFNLYWAPNKLNSVDYFSKHHAPSHHKLMRHV